MTTQHKPSSEAGEAWLMLPILLLILCSCSPDYSKIDPQQCSDWRSIAGYRWSEWSGGYDSFFETVCVTSEKKVSTP